MHSVEKIEQHMLALRNALDAAFVELERLKSQYPQAHQVSDGVAFELAMLNAKTWRKPMDSNTTNKRSSGGNRSNINQKFN